MDLVHSTMVARPLLSEMFACTGKLIVNSGRLEFGLTLLHACQFNLHVDKSLSIGLYGFWSGNIIKECYVIMIVCNQIQQLLILPSQNSNLVKHALELKCSFPALDERTVC